MQPQLPLSLTAVSATAESDYGAAATAAGASCRRSDADALRVPPQQMTRQEHPPHAVVAPLHLASAEAMEKRVDDLLAEEGSDGVSDSCTTDREPSDVELGSSATFTSNSTPLTSVTEESLQPAKKSSFSMQDIAAALRTCRRAHPFLDLSQQRFVVEQEKSQRLLNQSIVMGYETQMTEESQQIACKGLLNLAHRHQVEQLRRRYGDGKALTAATTTTRMAPATSPLLFSAAHPQKSVPARYAEQRSRGRSRPSAGHAAMGESQRRSVAQEQWWSVSRFVSSDFMTEGSAFVQRRLSCMCLFNPHAEERVYSDNEAYRERRYQRQCEVLMQLQYQRATGQNPYFLQTA